jgi:hypothetical protein
MIGKQKIDPDRFVLPEPVWRVLFSRTTSLSEKECVFRLKNIVDYVTDAKLNRSDSDRMNRNNTRVVLKCLVWGIETWVVAYVAPEEDETSVTGSVAFTFGSISPLPLLGCIFLVFVSITCFALSTGTPASPLSLVVALGIPLLAVVFSDIHLYNIRRLSRHMLSGIDAALDVTAKMKR